MNQPDFGQILKKAQDEIHCPVCNRHFDIKEIKLRGVFREQCLVQASCTNNHNPTLLLYIVGAESEKEKLKPLDDDDLINLHETLKNFQGNFKTIFSELDKRKKR